MKINFILPTYSNKPIGGYKIVYLYANYFNEKGHEVTITHLFGHDKNMKSMIRYGIKKILLSLKIYQLRRPNWFHLNKKIKIVHLDKKTSKNCLGMYDINIATAWYTATFLAEQKNGAKNYYFIQGFEIWNNNLKNVIASYRLPLNKIVISTYLKKILESYGHTTKLIPNFVDNEKFSITNPIENRAKVISSMYHSNKNKGFDIALAVLKRIKADHPGVRVIIFGVDDRPKKLPDNFDYIKNPNETKLAESIYNQSSIFLSTSLNEGWGLTVHEAMLCGCAVVSTDNGGVDDLIINKKNGLINKLNDIVGLTESVNELLSNDCYRKMIARRGREKASEYTLQSSADKFLNYLKGNGRLNIENMDTEVIR